MPCYEDIRLTKTIVKDCCEYVRDNFDNILPINITNGYSFQIRMNESTYNNLPNEHKSELKQFAYIGEQTVDDTVWLRYLQDFFWIYTTEYIFTFVIEHALHLQTKCVYGEEGIEVSDQEIVFLDSTRLPEFILLNIGLESPRTPKMP